MKLLCVLFSVVALCSGQFPSFHYDQQFGPGVRSGNGPLAGGLVENNHTFKLKQVPVQQTPVIVPPIPILRAVTNPVVVNQEPVAIVQPTVPNKIRRVVKKVRVVAEKPATQEVQVDSVVFPEVTEARPAIKNERNIDDLEKERQQEEAKNAHYSFSSSVQDTINDNTIVRSESRDGLALMGMYSYSDGFFKRTVHYQADENGYRVVKEEMEPIGQGPVYNPQGKADVESSLSGRYSITADDINLPKQNSRAGIKTKSHVE